MPSRNRDLRNKGAPPLRLEPARPPRTIRHVELVAVGDELLLGFTTDTNGSYIARKLAEVGIEVVRRTSVGDSRAAIAAAVREALERTAAVITTGGLGPTTDDLTREAVADVFNVRLMVDEAHLEWMRERWKARFNKQLPTSNRRQAMIPDGGRKLENKHGSAPGVYIEDHRGFVIMLPGVPRELMGMTDDTLLPLLHELRAGGAGQFTGGCIRSLTLRTTGIAESLLGDQITTIYPTGVAEDTALAYLPGVDGVDLRLTIRAADATTAAERLAKVAGTLRDALGDSIYGQDDDDLARVLLARLRQQERTLAVAESCTGGMLGGRITAIPGSSEVFVGGVIAYADDVKVRELGVSPDTIAAHGAVSEAVVRELAIGARSRFGADVALAITGVAGPGGGTQDKPVGLVWICAAVGEQVEPRRLQLWGDRQEIRYRATQAVMDLARRHL